MIFEYSIPFFPSNWWHNAWQLFNLSTSRILWNSFLAFIPFILSLWLFRLALSRSLIWWLMLSVFVCFLPNAPYILTDSIHLISYSQQDYAKSLIFLVLIPQYSIFIFIGFQLYVLSLLNLELYCRRQNIGSSVLSLEIILHFLSAIGIYLGRFLRLNSWHLVTQPEEVLWGLENLLHKKPLIFISICFLIIWLVYEINKRLYAQFFSPLH
jgi:uncharacterized membrane protein